MSVQVLCPNGRRVTVKLSPNTPLLYVVEQCCEKQGYDPSTHTLKHGRKTIDVSSPFRYSGLSNNAKLELVKSETVRTLDNEMVQLVVQTEDSQRFTGSFTPSTTLWSILETHNLTGGEMGGDDITFTVVYMRRQVIGEEELRRTALKDLGLLSGRGIVRLEKRKGEVQQETGPHAPLVEKSGHQTPSLEMKDQQEMASSSQHQTPSDENTGPKNSKEQNTEREEQCHQEEYIFPVLPFSIFPEEGDKNAMAQEPMAINTQEEREEEVKEKEREQMKEQPLEEPMTVDDIPLQKEEEEAEPMTTDIQANYQPIDFDSMFQTALKEMRAEGVTRQSVESNTYDDPCSRNTVIYHLNSVSATPNVELGDDFFDVTVNDIAMMQQDLRRQVRELNEAPLLTHAMKDKLRRSNSYSQTIMRIIFPDRWVLQGVFNTGESVRMLVLFTREHLADPKVKFHLYTTPPKTVLKSGRVTLREAGFVPAANIHFGFNEEGGADSSSPILSPTSISQYSSTADKAEAIAQLKRCDSRKDDQSGSDQTVSSGSGQSAGSTRSSTSGSGPATAAAGENSRSNTSGSGQKLPKWLKLGHK